MRKQVQTVIIVTAYGEDNYFQKEYEDVVGIYTSVKKAILGAKADGLTNSLPKPYKCFLSIECCYSGQQRW